MEVFSPVNIFGISVLSVMMLFYALESRKPEYTLLFGITCIGSSAYGFLSGAWPFGIIEAIWTLVSFRKYLKLKMGGKKFETPTS